LCAGPDLARCIHSHCLSLIFKPFSHTDNSTAFSLRAACRLKSFHRFALVFLFLIAAAALQGTAADDKPVAFWDVWYFLGRRLVEPQLLLFVLAAQRASAVTWMRSVGWAWSLEIKLAICQGPLDGLLVAWKGVVSKQRYFCKPNRTVAKTKRACGSFAHILLKYRQPTLRGSIVSELVSKRGVRECPKKVRGKFLTGEIVAIAKVSRLEVFAVFQDSNVTCGTFAEASSADWSAKEGCGNDLTGALCFVDVDIGHCWRVLKHHDVTCGTFAEASSADWSAK
jgi:hypothetical protein